ncbi:hypothetical protein LTR91_017867 [Friedmanniomyces endolithicus]|uniref:U1-C C2H2-type zinc finger domain-containing protein n=1 Tax=Friedmanniomyces endolithicus TaxID=329885 RepID=A0AAN6HCL3_9PEZI|nr:hypothetical protein LTS09_016735 [Friedmanniomyces endolithicus]KAK0272636.1 hypothetical protein LTS00_016154 [Friedmanniomyces endolithicus]KAK0273912.1 hypothetical protein LTR35_012040 [Friedmanniomyces endolithicus]KAK0307732.1 hypothetical protein LTR82_015872 [Friedmanniomyces endolithicus]KAK0926077.1 hypothetical protein LTR57_004326 [Friedmanniomyces endolithicus]
MTEYWKSTPTYWCKFCATFVKDTPIERKGHEQSGKHQGAIQKNLRELTKTKEREESDRKRAKDEVARLNGLVGGGSEKTGAAAISGLRDVTVGRNGGGGGGAGTGPAMSTAAQRKAHAEQLVALGVELPEELKREVTGVGSWQVMNERVVEEVVQPMTLADIKVKAGEEDDGMEGASRGVRRRRPEEEAEGEEEEAVASRRRTVWGSSVRTYPGANTAERAEDLDALLSVGFTKKQPLEVKTDLSEEKVEIKRERSTDGSPVAAVSVPEIQIPATHVKEEDDGEADMPIPAVVFKKRKVKR